MLSQDNWNDTRVDDIRTRAEKKSDNLAKAERWIKKQGFEVIRIGTPKDREYFINYQIEKDCQYTFFILKGRAILQAEYIPVFGTNEMVPNFDEKYRYHVVKRKKER